MAVQVISLPSASPSSQLFSTSPMASRRGRAAAASISLPPQPVNGRLHLPLAHANLNIAETEHDQQPQWWEKSTTAGHNMIKDINSMEELLSALVEAGDRLVVVEFYAPWCAACKALFPKLCKTAAAEQADEVVFLKVNLEENKGLCKGLNIRVLPYFHFYRGAHGKLDSFSCSLLKFKKLRDAIALHKIPPRASGSPKRIGDLTLESVTAPIPTPHTHLN